MLDFCTKTKPPNLHLSKKVETLLGRQTGGCGAEFVCCRSATGPITYVLMRSWKVQRTLISHRHTGCEQDMPHDRPGNNRFSCNYGWLLVQSITSNCAWGRIHVCGWYGSRDAVIVWGCKGLYHSRITEEGLRSSQYKPLWNTLYWITIFLYVLYFIVIARLTHQWLIGPGCYWKGRGMGRGRISYSTKR